MVCISFEQIVCAQQDTATQELSLSRTRESQLEEKIKVLEEARSDLEAEVEKYEKQIKQLEISQSELTTLLQQEQPTYEVRNCIVHMSEILWLCSI